jgi:hypothetical protein
MTYGIFNVESGNALAWFDSQEAAYAAVLRMADAEPEAIDELGLLAYGDDGAPLGPAVMGEELIHDAQAVAA